MIFFVKVHLAMRDWWVIEASSSSGLGLWHIQKILVTDLLVERSKMCTKMFEIGEYKVSLSKRQSLKMVIQACSQNLSHEFVTASLI